MLCIRYHAVQSQLGVELCIFFQLDGFSPPARFVGFVSIHTAGLSNQCVITYYRSQRSWPPLFCLEVIFSNPQSLLLSISDPPTGHRPVAPEIRRHWVWSIRSPLDLYVSQTITRYLSFRATTIVLTLVFYVVQESRYCIIGKRPKLTVRCVNGQKNM